MIIGDKRELVIENIRQATQREDFHCKVEVDDPVLTAEESKALSDAYMAHRNTQAFRMKAWFARKTANFLSRLLNRKTEIIGLEQLRGITGGAIVTSNHFSQIENTCIRYLACKLGKKRLNVVSQENNFMMTGFLGFLVNHADIIPITADPHYMQGAFQNTLHELLAQKELVLIYPEQEMWFHYRKPRPCKRGAYYYAAKMNVPVISCFVEQRDLPKKDRTNFYKVGYVIHVLKTLYPDPSKSVRENSYRMQQEDYAQKKAAYERIYGKALSYAFEPSDIAGWTGESP